MSNWNWSNSYFMSFMLCCLLRLLGKRNNTNKIVPTKGYWRTLYSDSCGYRTLIPVYEWIFKYWNFRKFKWVIFHQRSSVNVLTWSKMSSKDSSVMIRRDFNLVLSRWRSLPINQSVITVEKINPMSATRSIFEVWQAVMEEYQPTLQICFSVSRLGGALGFEIQL